MKDGLKLGDDVCEVLIDLNCLGREGGNGLDEDLVSLGGKGGCGVVMLGDGLLEHLNAGGIGLGLGFNLREVVLQDCKGLLEVRVIGGGLVINNSLYDEFKVFQGPHHCIDKGLELNLYDQVSMWGNPCSNRCCRLCLCS